MCLNMVRYWIHTALVQISNTFKRFLKQYFSYLSATSNENTISQKWETFPILVMALCLHSRMCTLAIKSVTKRCPVSNDVPAITCKLSYTIIVTLYEYDNYKH